MHYRGHVSRAGREYRHVDTEDTTSICGTIAKNQEEDESDPGSNGRAGRNGCSLLSAPGITKTKRYKAGYDR